MGGECPLPRLGDVATRPHQEVGQGGEEEEEEEEERGTTATRPCRRNAYEVVACCLRYVVQTQSVQKQWSETGMAELEPPISAPTAQAGRCHRQFVWWGGC